MCRAGKTFDWKIRNVNDEIRANQREWEED